MDTQKKSGKGRQEFRHPTEWTRALYAALDSIITSRKLERTKICEQAGLSRNFLTKLESGEKKLLSLDEVEPLAQALNVPIGDIFTLAQEKKTPKMIRLSA